ncbi:MAG: hypothetical protein HKO90_08185 [Flavobacteriaceae bacterium]|nr:hypothetical protein [Bacteroidia bacterium]NNK88246.1 hypothetical protein [Flavobacteriaceae bacterium]
MMKKIVLIGLSLFSVLAIAQSNEAFVQNNNTALNAASTGDLRAQGSSALFVNPAREVEGSVYLFEDWDNTAIIHMKDNQRFLLRNINLNLQRYTFESQISKDSLFTFNFNNIDKFEINKKAYRNYYWDDDNKVYEVIYDGKDFQVLKGFKLEFLEGSANPMLNRARDRYIKKENYFIRQDGRIRYFRLSKGKIMKLLKDRPDISDDVIEYAKRNRLSFKKEEDVRKILEYSDAI